MEPSVLLESGPAAGPLLSRAHTLATVLRLTGSLIRRLGAVADRMICALLRLTSRAPTDHYAPVPNHFEAIGFDESSLSQMLAYVTSVGERERGDRGDRTAFWDE